MSIKDVEYIFLKLPRVFVDELIALHQFADRHSQAAIPIIGTKSHTKAPFEIIKSEWSGSILGKGTYYRVELKIPFEFNEYHHGIQATLNPGLLLQILRVAGVFEHDGSDYDIKAFSKAH